MRANAVLIALVSLTLAATLFAAASREAPAPSGVEERLDRMDGRLQEIEDLLRATREDARRAARTATIRREESPDAAPTTAMAGVALAEQADVALGTAGLEQVVADSVERTVAKQMERMAAEKRHRGADGKWKPPMDEMATALELSESQRSALATIFDGARDEAFALLATQRDDGTNLLDDFARDLRESEDPKQPWTRLYAALTTRRVPGRNQTYLEALGEAEGRIRERVGANLDARQEQRFRALEVDVFDVRTGYDPVGEYVKARLGSDAE